MKNERTVAVALIILLLLATVSIPASASGTLGMAVSASPSVVQAGAEVEATVSLTGYTAEAAGENGIRGVQVDITEIDDEVLEVVEYVSLIEDSSALNNTASCQPEKNLVRLLYMRMNGTLSAPCEDVLRVKFRVADGVTESGSTTLPVTMLIQMEDNQKLTLREELVIQYTVSQETSDGISMKVSLSSSEVKAGEEVKAVVSLVGYTAEVAAEDGIRGLQVDITNVDGNVLEVVEHKSLIQDASALSNTTSVQSAKNLVRLLYMRMDGTLSAPYEEVMEVKFRMKEDATESGSITLPVTMSIQTENQKLTLKDEVTIIFTVEELKKEAFGFKTSPTAFDVNAGDEVEVKVSLTGYTEALAAEDAITGIQVDITGVDSSVLEVKEYASLIEDTTALSNTASYQPNKKLVRLLYVKADGTLAAPCTDIMKVALQVKSDLTKSGSITLPVTVLIKTESQQLTLKGQIEITYTVNETTITSVDIVWGAMEFTYTDGTWNQEKHRYEDAGWKDDGSGCIVISNTGAADTTATFVYQTDRTDVRGKIVNEAGETVETAVIAAGKEVTVYLQLSGKPDEDLDTTVIGKITVRIGE